MHRRATVTRLSRRLDDSPVPGRSDQCRLSAAMQCQRHRVYQAQKTNPISLSLTMKVIRTFQVLQKNSSEAGYLDTIYVHPSFTVSRAKPTAIRTERQSIHRSLVV